MKSPGNILLLIVFHWLISGLSAQRNVSLLDRWDTTGVPSGPGGFRYNDIIGFSQNGEDYLAVGSTIGTHVLWVKKEGSLQFVDFVPGKFQSPNVENRDMAYSNGFLYMVCDHGFSSLQIADLSFLPDSVSIVYDSDSLLMRAHSLVKDPERDRLYVCGAVYSSGASAIDVLDISVPHLPVRVGSFNLVPYVHDAYVRNDTAFLHCGFDGLRVVNFASPSSPIVIGSLENYADQGYNHSGWWSENGKYYVFTDETANSSVKLTDVSDLSDIRVISRFVASNSPGSIAHNPMIIGDKIFISWYFEGLQVFDWSSPQNVFKVGYFDTFGDADQIYAGAWGVHVFEGTSKVIVSDRQNGVFLLGYQFPAFVPDEKEHGIFPNPLIDEGWFAFGSRRSLDWSFSVFDLSGKVVFESHNQSIPQVKINATGWAPGMYFYRFEINGVEEVYSGKFNVIRP